MTCGVNVGRRWLTLAVTLPFARLRRRSTHPLGKYGNRVVTASR